MRNEIYEEKWLPSNMVRVDLVPLYRMTLMGIVFEDILLKIGNDSLLTSLLRLVMVPPCFCVTIGGVRRPY